VHEFVPDLPQRECHRAVVATIREPEALSRLALAIGDVVVRHGSCALAANLSQSLGTLLENFSRFNLPRGGSASFERERAGLKFQC
jgi:hypothetical protein